MRFHSKSSSWAALWSKISRTAKCLFSIVRVLMLSRLLDGLFSCQTIYWTSKPSGQNCQVVHMPIQHLFNICLPLANIDHIFLSKHWVWCRVDVGEFFDLQIPFRHIILCNIQTYNWLLLRRKNVTLLNTNVQWPSCVSSKPCLGFFCDLHEVLCML